MNKASQVLAELLSNLGCTIKHQEAEQVVKCCFHADKTPSLAVNLESAVYYCHACDARGDAVSLYKETHNCDMRTALLAVGKGDDDSKPSIKQEATKNKGRSAPPEGERHFDYFQPDGTFFHRVVRGTKITDGEEKKTYYNWCLLDDGLWYAKAPVKGSRQLYNLKYLQQIDSAAQVIVVEGEKVADALTHCLKRPCLAWPGGAKVWAYAQWQAVKGRKVLYIADRDEAGRKCAEGLATFLTNDLACEVKVCMPGGDDGWDLADAIEIDGWDKAQVAEWIKANSVSWAAKEDKSVTKEVVKSSTPVNTEVLKSNEHFRLLGYDEDYIWAYRCGIEAVVSVTRTAILRHAGLLQIHPNPYWWTNDVGYGDITRASPAARAGTDLIRESEKLGLYKHEGQGRGAYWHNKEIYWHLGDCVMLPSGEKVLPGAIEDRVLTKSHKLSIADAPLSEQELVSMAAAISAYRWQNEIDAAVMQGWLVSSMLSGVLHWRSHCWLLGAVGTGKTWLLEELIDPLLGSWVKGRKATIDTSPSALARQVAADCLPHITEEADGVGRDNSLDTLLEVGRYASSATAGRIRSGAGKSIIELTPKASMLSMAPSVGSMKERDRSRWAIVRLSMAEVEDWPTVMQAIQDTAKKSAGWRTSVVNNAHKIIESIALAKKLIQEVADTRTADQYGVLLGAAAWWRKPSGYSFEVVNLVDKAPWGGKRNMTADSEKLLATILSIRIEWDRSRHSVADLLAKYTDSFDALDFMKKEQAHPQGDKTLQARLTGFGVVPTQNSEVFEISPTAPEIRQQLQNTDYANIGLREVLLQHPNASVGKQKRNVGNEKRPRLVAFDLRE